MDSDLDKIWWRVIALDSVKKVIIIQNKVEAEILMLVADQK